MKGGKVMFVYIMGVICLAIIAIVGICRVHDLHKENRVLKKTIVDLKEEITEYRGIEIMKAKCREREEGIERTFTLLSKTNKKNKMICRLYYDFVSNQLKFEGDERELRKLGLISIRK